MGRGIPASSRISWLLVMVLAVALFSCQGAEVRKKTDDREALKKRVTEYWNYKIRREFDRAYQMELPLYRKTVSMVRYIKRFHDGMYWTGVDIKNIEMDEGAAWVMVGIQTRTIIPGIPQKKGIGYRSTLRERWIKEGGVWYHVPRKFLKRATISGT